MSFNGRPPPAFSLGGFVTGGAFNPHMPGGVFVPATQVGIISGPGRGGIITRAAPMQIRHRPPQPMGQPKPPEQMNNDVENNEGDSDAPKTTVFVGNISEKAPDVLIRQLLARCGSVLNWKRVQGASGNLQAFGFCEYREPENTLRAIRLLHDLALGDKNLLVKVDAKTRALLDSYLSEKNKKRGTEGSEDEIDDKTRMEDQRIKMEMNRLIVDYRGALHKPSRPPMGAGGNAGGYRQGGRPPGRPYGAGPGDMENAGGNMGNDTKQMLKKPKEQRDEKIDDIEMEADKKKIISREIDRFRLTHKDETIEVDDSREPPEEKERSRDRSSDRERRKERDTDRLRERERDRDRERERRKERERREKEERELERQRLRRERENRERMEEERERERSSSSASRRQEKERERERERAREREKMGGGSDAEDEYERRKLEKKLKEKEYAYQERLKNWVARERKKGREYEKYKDKEKNEKVEMDKDKRSLHDFLEDYDDDKQDIKYYKGSALEKRREDREKEMEADMRDRRREAEEIHEIKRRLKDEGSENLQEELARLEQERDGHKRRLLDNVDLAELLSQAKAQPKHEEPIAIDDDDDGEINDEVHHGSEENDGEINDLEIDETGEIVEQPMGEQPQDTRSRDRSRSRDQSRSRDHSRDRSRSQSPEQPPLRETFKKRTKKESRKLRREHRRKDTDEEDGGEEERQREEEPRVEEEPRKSRTRSPTPEEAEPMEDMYDMEQEEEQRPAEMTAQNLKPAFEEVRQELSPEPEQPEAEEVPKEAKRGMGFGGLKLGAASSPTIATKSKRKKKMTVEQVFNQDDEGGDGGPKKRKLIPIDYSEEEMKAVREVKEKEEQEGAPAAAATSNVAEEKRKSIKNLIEKIPTEKSELFAYQLDWTIVDSNLMERRIRPWINKKIIEYIGEEEPTLTDFICTKLLEHSGPQDILKDISMVLDEEAEVFVVKMWRLLIYEVEAKKHGLVK